jgi:ABC-type dipeptide/oligopeptide/nickel transport system ATPase component
MSLLAVEDLRVDLPTSAGLLHPVRGVSFALERG